MSPLRLSCGDIESLILRKQNEGCSDEILERLRWLAEYADGKSVSTICREAGIARTTFYRWLRRFDPSNLTLLSDKPTHPPVHLRTNFRPPVLSEEVIAEVSLPKNIAYLTTQTPCCAFCRFRSLLKKHINPLRVLVILSLLLNLALLSFLLLPHAEASTWNPTLLVNTEAFQVIDEGDSNDDIKLQFGDTVNERIYWERSADRFSFTDDLHAEGEITGSGGLVVDGNVRFPDLINCDTIDTDSEGNLVCGIEEGSGTGAAISITTTTNAPNPGRNDLIDIFEDTYYGGSLTYDTNVAENIIFTPSDGHFTVETSGTYAITLDVIPQVSAALNADIGIWKNGNPLPVYLHDYYVFQNADPTRVSATIILSLESGDYIEFTIESLDNDNIILQDGTTANIGILGRGGDGSGEGDADARYVNRSGDSMTGTLTLANGAGLSASGTIATEGGVTVNMENAIGDAVLTFGNDLGAETLRFSDTSNQFEFSDDLEVMGSLSGASLSAAGGSATIASDGTAIFNELARSVNFRIESDNEPNLFFVHGTNDRVGIGTSDPQTTLEVSGAMSGTSLYTGEMNNSRTAMEGSVLVAQSGNAPVWATQSGALSWYLDSDALVAQSQGAIVTMPFSMAVSSVILKARGAPAGSALIVDINEEGSTLFSTPPQISAGQTSGGGGAVFSDTELAAGSVITVDIDQVGSTFSGSGITIQLNGYKKY